jgi:hypothetical protein
MAGNEPAEKAYTCFHKTMSMNNITVLLFLRHLGFVYSDNKRLQQLSRKRYTYTSNLSQREQACKRSSGEINSRTNKQKKQFQNTIHKGISSRYIHKQKHRPVPLARLKRQYTSTSAIIPPALSTGTLTKSAS